MRDLRVLPSAGTGARTALVEMAGGAKLDQRQWLAAGRGWRLAARVAEVRACGWLVEADRAIETQAGGRAACYSMPESERHIARQKLDEMEAAMARAVAKAGGGN